MTTLIVKKRNLASGNVFCSTLNFVLVFIGYPLVTTLFLPFSSSLESISRAVTIPYRGFALLISLLVIAMNIRETHTPHSKNMIVFWLFWLFLIIRIFYDLNLKTGVFVLESSQLWLFIFGVCLSGVFSVYKSYNQIDFEKALNWIVFSIFLILAFTLFFNKAEIDSIDKTSRMSGNIALNTISFGHVGVMGVIISLFVLKTKRAVAEKLIALTLLLISFYALLRSGSRGPIFSLLIVILFWIISKKKYSYVGWLYVILILSAILLYTEPLLSLIGELSPVMELRLRDSIYEGDRSGREGLYSAAFNLFLDHPFLGKQFAFIEHGYIVYSHNVFLDALMALGILGGFLMLWILCSAISKSFYIIKNNVSESWIALILIQQIVFLMTSSAFYYNQMFNVLLTVVFLYASKKKNEF